MNCLIKNKNIDVIMKSKIVYLLTLFLLISFTKSFAQDSLKFVGGLNRYNEFPPEQLESANFQVWYEFEREVVKNKEAHILIDTMVLVIGNNFSIYYDWNRETRYKNMIGQLDVAKKTTENIVYNSIDQFLEMAVDNEQLSEFTMNRENSEILKDRNRQLIITTDMSDLDIQKQEYYLLKENIYPHDWVIHDESREIMGYTCQRATCNFRGRDYNAWFTIEIPVNDGPYKFYGLPGLILSIEDTESEVKFSAIGMEKLENTIITAKNKSNYIECTLDQYNTIKKRMQQTTVSYYNRPSMRSLHVTKVHVPIEYTTIEIGKQ